MDVNQRRPRDGKAQVRTWKTSHAPLSGSGPSRTPGAREELSRVRLATNLTKWQEARRSGREQLMEPESSSWEPRSVVNEDSHPWTRRSR